MKKINVYYIGFKGKNFKKTDDYLHAYYPGKFNLVHFDSIKKVANKTLSFRDFIIVDRTLKPQSSLNVLREIKSEIAKMGCVSICLTNSLDHNTVSSIAEIGFDGVLVKPFNFKAFKNVIDSIKPFSFESSDYYLTIQRGRNALYRERNLTKSYTIFKKSLEKHDTPSLGYYYLGKTCEAMNRDVNAINHYRRGLKLNRWHFNSLNSLLNVYIRHKDKDEAFNLIKHITSTYPESPERFCLAVKLAVRNFRFDEVPLLIEAFNSIKNRTPEIEKHFFAGLYVSAKHFLHKDKIEQADVITQQLLKVSHKSPFYKAMLKSTYKEYGKEEKFLELLEAA